MRSTCSFEKLRPKLYPANLPEPPPMKGDASGRSLALFSPWTKKGYSRPRLFYFAVGLGMKLIPSESERFSQKCRLATRRTVTAHRSLARRQLPALPRSPAAPAGAGTDDSTLSRGKPLRPLASARGARLSSSILAGVCSLNGTPQCRLKVLRGRVFPASRSRRV